MSKGDPFRESPERRGYSHPGNEVERGDEAGELIDAFNKEMQMAMEYLFILTEKLRKAEHVLPESLRSEIKESAAKADQALIAAHQIGRQVFGRLKTLTEEQQTGSKENG